MEQQKQAEVDRNIYAQAAITYGYIALWITLSATVILVNKYILAVGGFPLPITLTLIHMAFCSTLAFTLIRLKVCDPVYMDSKTYLKTVVPIAALFSGTLWFGNAAYIYLSVSFIQMLKAITPISVFVVGILLGTERYSASFAANMVLVAFGIAIASYGEINFHPLGVFCQLASMIFESFRLVLIQILLQSRGIKLNPVTTLYYVAPACFAFLCIPFAFIELPKLLGPAGTYQFPTAWISLSAISAFALNMSVFLLIGRSSALTMNVAGVVKDWILIGLSVMLFKSPVAALQIFGYLLAFGGVCWYNFNKLQQARKAAAAPTELSEEKVPLVAMTGTSKDKSLDVERNGNHGDSK